MNRQSVRMTPAIFLSLGLALALGLPLWRGEFVYTAAEGSLYGAFLRRFLETLGKGELPLWNPYVGGGHPAAYFGHYPVHLAALVYYFLGVTPQSFALMKSLDLFLLIAGYLYAARLWRFPLLPAALGAMVYLGANFGLRLILPDTVSNVIVFFPLVFLLLIKAVGDGFEGKRDLIVYYFAFVFWVSGVSVTFLFMPFCVLCWAFLDQARQRALGTAKTTWYFLALLVAPWITILYQLYFVGDLIVASNRLKPGLVISPFSAEPWAELFRSLISSSYLWVALIALSVTGIFRRGKTPAIRITLFSLLLLALAFVHRFLPEADLLGDYLTLARSPSFWLASLLFFSWGAWTKGRAILDRKILGGFFVLASLLSYYFYLPENIPGFSEPGYDYALFIEMGCLAQTVIVLGVFFSLFAEDRQRETRLAIGGLIVLYFLRSHLALLFLRFGGIVWYATRDGLIFSLFFSVLFICGCVHWLRSFSSLTVRSFVCVPLLFILLQTVHDKMYVGGSHMYLYPQAEKHEVIEETAQLRERLAQIQRTEPGFFRLFSPGGGEMPLAGAFQDLGIYEAGLYDSSIPQAMDSFYKHVLLGQPTEKAPAIRDLLPYAQFTKHVHRGLGLSPKQIAYHDFYLYEQSQSPYLRNQSIELWWDLAQVRYLLVEPSFTRVLDTFSTRSRYRPVAGYPWLSLRLYRREKPTHGTFALLLPEGEETEERLLTELNSPEPSELRRLASRLQFLDDLRARRPRNSALFLDVEAPRAGLLIQLESWNRHWQAKRDGVNTDVQRAFHIFRAIPVHAGLNHLELEYALPIFRALMVLGLLFPFLFVAGVYRAEWLLTRFRSAMRTEAAGAAPMPSCELSQ